LRDDPNNGCGGAAFAKSKKSNPQHVQEVNKNAQNRKKFERSKSSKLIA